MSEDIDTAAIRANVKNRPDTEKALSTAGELRALCDALDAARANLELADSNAALADMALEAAEAERDNLQHSLDRDLAGDRKRVYQVVLRGATNADYDRSQRDYWAMRDRAEAAEAERDEAIGRSGAQWKRATDAEARIAEMHPCEEFEALEADYRAAEARIAAALARTRRFNCPNDKCEACDLARAVRRALTGGTE